MMTTFKSALAIAAAVLAGQAMAQVTFYEHDNFQGRSFSTERQIGNFERFGFSDRASSVVVQGERWEACEEVRFGGRCVVLRPGQYPSLSAMGLNDRISSVRAIERGERVEEYRLAPVVAAAQVTFYEREGFEGRSFSVSNPIEDFGRFGFNDRASSVVVVGSPWVVCEDIRYGGRCAMLRPGQYPSLQAMGLNDRISSVRAFDRNDRIEDNRSTPEQMAAQVIFYEREGFEGRSFTADKQVDDFGRAGFNDRAASAVVLGERWEACSDAEFRGRCVVLRPGRYPSLDAMGMNKNISSVRSVRWEARVDDNRYAPTPVAVYDNRRRNDDRLYEVNITTVRAVMGPAEQRCWVEREPVAQGRGDVNMGGALAGALIGGILGHQVGGGTGKDVATVGGAFAGAVVGANVGRDRNGQPVQPQDVQRCSSTPSQAAPAYWDVTYTFRGLEHRIQMATQPGPTLTVNEQGEPRT